MSSVTEHPEQTVTHMDELKRLKIENESLRTQICNLMSANAAKRMPPNEMAIPMPMLAPASLLCGVYFLCMDGKVVYVGQSRNVAARVAAHASDGAKAFDFVWFMPCDAQYLDCIERYWIDFYGPQYNNVDASVLERISRPLWRATAKAMRSMA